MCWYTLQFIHWHKTTLPKFMSTKINVLNRVWEGFSRHKSGQKLAATVVQIWGYNMTSGRLYVPEFWTQVLQGWAALLGAKTLTVYQLYLLLCAFWAPSHSNNNAHSRREVAWRSNPWKTGWTYCVRQSQELHPIKSLTFVVVRQRRESYSWMFKIGWAQI